MEPGGARLDAAAPRGPVEAVALPLPPNPPLPPPERDDFSPSQPLENTPRGGLDFEDDVAAEPPRAWAGDGGCSPVVRFLCLTLEGPPAVGAALLVGPEKELRARGVLVLLPPLLPPCPL